MKITFRYGRWDGRAILITTGLVLVVGLAVAWLFATSGGAYYLPVWVLSLAVALLLLCLLSLPTRIILSDNVLELRCLVDTTLIPLESIADVEVVGPSGFRHKFPLFGSCGFMGYLGRYVDTKNGKIHRIYATNRKCGVAIHTSKRRYLVSCKCPDLFVATLNEARKMAAQE